MALIAPHHHDGAAQKSCLQSRQELKKSEHATRGTFGCVGVFFRSHGALSGHVVSVGSLPPDHVGPRMRSGVGGLPLPWSSLRRSLAFSAFPGVEGTIFTIFSGWC